MTATVPATVPDLVALRADAEEADARFSAHFAICPSRSRGSWCTACDDLDMLANHAESTYRRARVWQRPRSR